jgi:hypothetical protein
MIFQSMLRKRHVPEMPYAGNGKIQLKRHAMCWEWQNTAKQACNDFSSMLRKRHVPEMPCAGNGKIQLKRHAMCWKWQNTTKPACHVPEMAKYS